MKFSIGDKIVVKHTGEEGHVTAYIDKHMVEVEVHGVKFPVHTDEIDHPYLKWFTEKKPKKKTGAVPEQLPVEKEKFRKPRLAKGIYLSFLPVFKIEEMEDIVDHLKVYLLNELPQSIQFGYDARFMERTLFSLEGKLHGFGHLYLHSIPYDDMNDQPRFHWRLADADKEMQPVDGILKIKPARVFAHINELLQNNEPTFSYLLAEDFLPKQKIPKPEQVELPKPKPFLSLKNLAEQIEQPKYELDLHVEKLVPSKKGMSNAEILQIQLDTLRRYLDIAILHRQQRMFVIHGVGKGVLKEEVHKVLRQTPQVHSYENEYYPRYGFGATEVFFSY